MSLQDIALVSFGYFENEFLEKVAGEISRDFQFQVRIKEGHMDLSEFRPITKPSLLLFPRLFMLKPIKLEPLMHPHLPLPLLQL